MNYAFSCAGLGCCLGPLCSLAAGELGQCVRAMGHGTPDNMNRAGLLQVSDSKCNARFILSDGV